MNPSIKLPAVIFGGTGYESANQDMPESIPEKYEMGTLNISGVAGLNAALDWIQKTTIEEIKNTEAHNRKKLIDLLEEYEFIRIVGNEPGREYVGIKKGYDDRNQIIEKALLAQIAEEPTDYYSMERLNLLASLIADGVMDIQIAYTEDQRGIGMYHEKMGIIEDAVGDKIAFSGSNNESATAMSINYETMDVFRSWGDPSEIERVRLKENAFYSIWHDTEPNIKVLEFPNITGALIEKYRRKSPNFNIDKDQFARRILTYATKLTEMSRESSTVNTGIYFGSLKDRLSVCIHDTRSSSTIRVDEVASLVSFIIRSFKITITKRCLKYRECRYGLAVAFKLGLTVLICCLDSCLDFLNSSGIRLRNDEGDTVLRCSTID